MPKMMPLSCYTQALAYCPLGLKNTSKCMFSECPDGYSGCDTLLDSSSGSYTIVDGCSSSDKLVYRCLADSDTQIDIYLGFAHYNSFFWVLLSFNLFQCC